MADTVNMTSFGNTPQAKDDVLSGMTESALEASFFFMLDVMANDLGGTAKTLYSVDDGTTATGAAAPSTAIMQDLASQDVANDGLLDGRSAQGAELRIVNGKVEVRADAAYLSKVSATAEGQWFTDTFVYAIKLGNGTLSWAKVTFTLAGANDAPVITSSEQLGSVKEDTALTASGSVDASDADNGAVLTYTAASTAGVYGSFAVNSANGDWTYTLANGTNGTPSAVQSLAAGESHTEVFTVNVSDGLGGTTSQNVKITVTGTNDAPVITSDVQSGAVQEDTTLSVSGSVDANDIDNSATLTYTATVTAGIYGSIAVNASNGDWTYTLANGTNGTASEVQSLAAGETHDEVFTVNVSDGVGGTTSQTVTVTVTGTNDAPAITSAVQAGTVKEDTTLSVSGSVDASDVDNGAVLTYTAASTAGVYGTFTVNSADGDWTYTLANGTNGTPSAVQSLAVGESHTEVFTVNVSDGAGGTTSQNVTITVTGTNDAPAITSAVQAGTVKEDTTLSVSGSVDANDIDNGATLTYTATATAGTYGSIAVNATSGDWTYTLANGTDGTASAVQSLAAGESHDEVFTVNVSDGVGGTISQNVTITVAGTNDAPVITSAVQTGTVKEDTTLSVSGSVDASDIDNGATLTYTAVAAAGVYGSIAVSSSNGDWTYTLANGTDGTPSAVQSLAAGESHTEVFTVNVSDGVGGTTSQDVTITVTGTNDAPVITSAVQAGAVKEDATLSVSGSVDANDIDNGAVLTYTAASTAGVYGTFAVNSANGDWTYTLANGTNGTPSVVQSLAVGESHTEVFTVNVSDGVGGTTNQNVTITVTGTNDAPAITSAAQSGAVQEDTTLSVSGSVDASDIDNGAVLSYAAAATAGVYGSIAVNASNGDWTYTLANGTNGTASAVQSLAAGESHDEVFTVNVSDGLGGTTSQTVTITVTGTNDAPAITSAAQSGTVQEDTTLSVSGSVDANDIDNGAVHSYAAVANAGIYGSIAVNASNGDWTYTLANGTNGTTSPVQSLAAGESHDEVFTVNVSDGLGGTTSQTVTITVTGTNDAPAITSAVQSGAVQEDTTLSVSGSVDANDIDNGATLTYTAVATAGIYGSIAVNASNGDWTYTLANGTDGTASAVQSLAAGESHDEVFTVNVSDGVGGTTSQTVTVTVTGTNDAPTTTPVTLTSIAEDSGVRVITQAQLLANASDIDNSSLTATSLAIATGAGSLANNGNGTWNYTPATNDDTQVSFSYLVNDGSLSAAGTATLDITPVNDAPTTTPVTLTAIAEDSGVRVITQAQLLANANDVDGPSFAATGLLTTTGAGTLANNGDGTWNYTPALNDDTQVSFSYTVTDGSLTAAGSATLDVTPVNDAPTTTAVTLAAIAEDSGVRVITQAELLANATDGDSTNLTATSLAIATGAGLLTANANGTWNYTPAANDDTQVSFSYTVSDGTLTAAGSATLDITPVNDAPTTTAVTLVAIAEDSGIRVITQAELLANAADVDNTTLTATGLAIATGIGSLTPNADGTWNYTPAADDDTQVSFSYTVTDGNLSAAGSATLDITPVADAPTTTAVTLAAIAEDSGVRVITQAELLANATDGDSTNLTATSLAIATGAGLLTANANGTWNYTPAANDDTQVSFSYTVSDGTLTAAGSATLDITPVNDAPTTTAVTLVAIAEDSGIRVITQAELLANAADVDNTTLTATGLAIATGIGSLTPNADGTWNYTPAADDDTQVSFSYTVTDGNLSAAGSATLDITPVADVPVVPITDMRLTVTAVPDGNSLPSGAFAQLSVPGGAGSYTYSLASLTVTNLASAPVSGGSLAVSSSGVVSATSLADGRIYQMTVQAAQGPSTYTETFRVITGTNSSETLTAATGDDVIFAQGNNDFVFAGGGDDNVFGQAADDQLHGGLGNDALSGANGNDTFFFDTALNATTNVDHVTDFNASQDTVWLSKGVFSSLASAGTASGTTLVAADYAEVATGGATATIDAAAHILYDAATGSLYFDADGGTSANRTLFAILDSKPDLGDMGAGDFKVGL